MTDTAIIGKLSDLLIVLMNDEEVNQFSPAGLLPLSDERILLGEHYRANRTSPSRVIFVPINSTFGPPAAKSNWISETVNGKPNVQPGFLSRIIARPLATDQAEYLVYCWGQSASEDDHEKDFDATRWLTHLVIRACQRLTMTSVKFFRGLGWIDQAPGGASLMQSGHEFCFGVTLDIPVIDSSDQMPPKPLQTANTVKVQ